MILWYAAGAVFAVWNVFQSPGLDFRLVAVGAVLPLALDAPFGEMGVAHSLGATVLLLAATMAVTGGRGRRLLRRRAIGLPIGAFCGLVLSGAWATKEVFWWPAFGTGLPGTALLPPAPLLVAEEALGLAAAAWAWSRFGLADPARRRRLWCAGRLDEVVG